MIFDVETRRNRTVAPVGLTIVLIAATLAIFWAPIPLAAIGILTYIVAASKVPLPALCLIVVSLPFYLLDRHFGRLEFSPTEILIVLTAVGGGLRLGWLLLSGRFGSSIVPRPDLGIGPTRLATRLVGDPVIAGLAV
ncbi:MAG: hypothetical protein ACRDIY_07490, partial [Chloroflexota bacterium]